MQDEFGDQGIDYEIIPFPIENREVDLSKLIPVGTIMTMGYCDEWTTQKILLSLDGISKYMHCSE